MRRLTLLLICLLTFSVSHAEFDFGFSPSEKEFLDLIQQETEDPFIADWLVQMQGERIRFDLDKEVNNILRDNPLAKKLAAQLRPAIEQSVKDVSRQNKRFFSKAYLASESQKPQHQELLMLLQNVMYKMMIPRRGIESANFFVAEDPNVNAWTPAAWVTDVQMVFFVRLLEIMNDHGKAFVMGHELGHIVLGHVTNGILLQTIFETSGQILIPDHSKDAAADPAGKDSVKKAQVATREHLDRHEMKVEAFKEMVRKESLQMIRSAMGAECHGAGCASANTPAMQVLDKIATSFSKVASRVAKEFLAENASNAETLSQLKSLAGAFQALAAKGKKADDDETGGDDEEKPFKKFQRLMTELSQAQESSSDVHGMLAVGAEGARDSFPKMMGGPNATWEGILQQHEEDIREITGQGQAIAEEYSHPTTASRVMHFQTYPLRVEYRVMRDPILNALDIYFRLTNSLTETEGPLTDNKGKLSSDQVVAIKRRVFSSFARRLASWLTSEILHDFVQTPVAGRKPYEAFSKTIEYITELSSKMGVSVDRQDLVGKDRLLDQILRSLQALNTAPAAKAADLLEREFPGFNSQSAAERATGELLQLPQTPLKTCKQMFGR